MDNSTEPMSACAATRSVSFTTTDDLGKNQSFHSTRSLLGNGYVELPSTGPDPGGTVEDVPATRQKERKSPQEKCIARVVMAVSLTLFLISVVLVAGSLRMSAYIDEMVRNTKTGEKSEPNHSSNLTTSDSTIQPSNPRNSHQGDTP